MNNDMRITLNSILNQKWVKIFSVYKDNFREGTALGSLPMIEFTVYGKNPVNNSSNECLISSTFQFANVQAEGSQGNVTNRLQKLTSDNYFETCYNITTDAKNRRITNVYVRYVGSGTYSSTFLHINKCPMLNAFRFYAQYPEQSTITDSVMNTQYVAPTLSKWTGTYEKQDGTKVIANLSKEGHIIVASFKIQCPSSGAHDIAPSDTNNFIPTEFRPNDDYNVGTVVRNDKNGNQIIFTVWSQGHFSLYTNLDSQNGITTDVNLTWVRS